MAHIISTDEASHKGWSFVALRKAMRLYAVTDSSWLRGRLLRDCVAEALAGGATFIQLREKNLSHEQLVACACDMALLCKRAQVPFVINDDVAAALESHADGVHVGQDDMACSEARSLLGPHKIVGVSVQTVDQARKAEKAGASYLGVGALFGTPTKRDAVLVSLDELKAIVQEVSIPVVAIGGLNSTTLPMLASTGVDGAAVVSAIFAADNIKRATRTLSDIIADTILA